MQKVRKDDRKYFVEETSEQSQLIAYVYTPELRARISQWPDFL